jgi:D-beta-D-heptose 7-phosphate kinase/D-beta-D-heptose 1-phosphate adenosyltransferase
VFDVSGAGDTVLAALGAALGAGAGLDAAVHLAVLASGVVVGKAGTATVTPDELLQAELAEHALPLAAKLADIEGGKARAEAWRRVGLRVGFTNGCFDILHAGHVDYLARARARCDRLIVGVNSDASIRRLKGAARPVNDLQSRAMVLAAMAAVDLVIPFDDDTPLDLITATRPDALFKGADYDRAGVVGGDLVESWGGEVVLVPLVEGYSTTAAVERLLRAKPEDAR